MKKVMLVLIVVMGLFMTGCEKEVIEPTYCWECTQQKIYHMFNKNGEEVNYSGEVVDGPYVEEVITEYCGTREGVFLYEKSLDNNFVMPQFNEDIWIIQAYETTGSCIRKNN